MIMSSEQLTIEIIESFCKHNELNYEKVVENYLIWEHSCCMSSVTLRLCLSLATILNAHYYLSSMPNKGLCFVLYNVGSTKLPF